MELTAELKTHMKAHAEEAYPFEACGIVAGGVYVPLANTAEDCRNDFVLPARTFVEYEVQAVFHSHPDAADAPSESDMKSQIETAVPWILCTAREDGASEPYMWGSGYIPPLVGREFRHGPSGTDGKGDCYALIKDWYQLERNIKLPEIPRSNEWWKNGGRLYEENFAAAGFRATDGLDPRPGDVAFMAINCSALNHAAVYIGGGMFLQHLTNRLSRRDPAPMWAKMIRMWVRHDG